MIFDFVAFCGNWVSFDGARFSAGQVSFNEVTFDHGVSFDGARFSAGQVPFNEVTFDHGVSFDGAIFSGDQVSFNDATFSGDHVTFNDATYDGTHICFDGSVSPNGVLIRGLDKPDRRLNAATITYNGAAFEGRLPSQT